jgi:DNA-binding beta-propeller fold protein YncE
MDASGLRPVLIRSVTIDRTGNIYLPSSETGKIYVYGPDESFLYSFGSKGGTPGRLSQPRGVAIDEEKGLMYVVDYMRHTILTYDKEGTYLFEFGGKGDAPGWFRFPTDVIVNKRGQVIVSDLFNHRLQVLEVKYQKDFPSLEELKRTSPTVNKTNGAGSAAPGADSSGAALTTDGEPGAATEEFVVSPDAGNLENALDEQPTTQPDAEVKEVVLPPLQLPAFPDAQGQ